MIDSTPELWDAVWRLLTRATADKKHAYSTPVLATVMHSLSEPGGESIHAPRLRTVVLRAANRQSRLLTAYTDRRSQKVKDLDGTRQHLAWCFWDKRSRIQFTGYGPTSQITGPESHQIFDGLPKHSRKAYATLSSPGSTLGMDGVRALPDTWEDLDLQATGYARDNFCVLRTELWKAEVLRLSRSGHQRLRAEYDRAAGRWVFTWVVP